MPTLTASAPASISALAPSRGRDVAGDDLHFVGLKLDPADRVEHALRVAVGSVDHDQVDAGVDQRLGAGEPGIADARRRGHAQAPLLVLAGVGMQALPSRCPSR